MLFTGQCMKTACLLQVSDTIELRRLRSTERNKYMCSAAKTDILKDGSWSIAQNDPLSTLRRAKATVIATTGVSASKQLVVVVLKILGYSRKKDFYFIHGHLPPKSQRQRSWSVTFDMKHRGISLFFQVTRHPSHEKVGSYMGIRGGEDHSMYEPTGRERRNHLF